MSTKSITKQLPSVAEIESRLAVAVREVNVLRRLLRIARRIEKQTPKKGVSGE